jgi:hypothetical protein
MTYAFDIPGYIQGHRFSDDPLSYDASTKRFLDQAGYGERADLQITVGNPVFSTVGAQRCVLLDNTFHGRMPMPIPWAGSAVFVLKPNFVSGGTLTKFLLHFGDDPNFPTNAGSLYVQHFSGERRVVLVTGSSQLSATWLRNDNNTMVLAFAFDQSTRKAYVTSDGISLAESSAPASTVHGSAVALASAQYGVRFGSLGGATDDTSMQTDLNCYMFEHHFFAGNILTESLAVTKNFIDTLKAKYGAV